MREREREREREYFESRNSNGHISVFHHWIELGFWIYYAPHHPLTSDRWDLKDLVFFYVKDITLTTFQEKPIFGPVMIVGGFLLRPSLDPTQCWIYWSY
jgi:hypothetical protein